jgi:hypothetical protein
MAGETTLDAMGERMTRDCPWRSDKAVEIREAESTC